MSKPEARKFDSLPFPDGSLPKDAFHLRNSYYISMENDRELRAELERLNRAGIINDEEYLVLRELVGRKKLSGETKDRFDRLFRKKSVGRSAASRQSAGADPFGEENRESDTVNGSSSALSPELNSAFASICALQDKLNQLGGFDHRRDLLECPSCGLQEDVNFEGKLITCQREAFGIETGLMFADRGTSGDRRCSSNAVCRD